MYLNTPELVSKDIFFACDFLLVFKERLGILFLNLFYGKQYCSAIYFIF